MTEERIVIELYEELAAFQKRRVEPTAIRIGPDAWQRLLDAIAPSLLGAGEWTPFYTIKMLQTRQEERQRMKDSWGKEGSMLLGFPVICDEELSGWEWVLPAPLDPLLVKLLNVD